MKKITVAMFLLLTGESALAQSSLNIWGTVDIGYRWSGHNVDSHVGSRSAIDSGTHMPSRIAFQGTEDLGGGWKAGFVLESALNLDTGTQAGGSLFSRQSFLSLGGGFGQLAWGRQYTPGYLLTSSIDPFGDVTIGHYNNVYLTEFRWDNQLSYTTPNFNGFSLSAAYTLNGYGQESNENRSKTGDIRAYSIVPRYQHGPFLIGAHYQELKRRSTGDGDGDKIRVYDLGATYDFGWAKVAALYGARQTSATDFSPDTGWNAGKSSKQWLVGATIPVSANDKVLISCVHRKTRVSDGGNDAKSWQGALGYEHFLSRRTRIYVTLSLLGNSSEAKDSGLVSSVGAGYNAGSGYQRGVALGIRHDF
ncbi:MAG: porin [Azoarcus sp.]|nr:porin [Azoarcus sp.]